MLCCAELCCTNRSDGHAHAGLSCRLFGDEGTSNKQQPDRGSLGSSQFDSQQLQRGDHSPPLPPAARPPNQQQQDGEGAARTDDALLASADARATPAPVPSTAVGADASSSQQQQQKAAATDPDFDPLHDSLTDSEKEAEQLSALSRVIQQQQDTITKQVRCYHLSYGLGVLLATYHNSTSNQQLCYTGRCFHMSP